MRSLRAPLCVSNNPRVPLTTDSTRKEPRMELGLYTFADVGPEIDPARRLHNLLEEIELADQLGLDVFGVGEDHSPDERGHGSELRGPRARLPRLRHARSHLGRPRGDYGRPRLVHRVVSAVRLR